MRMVDEWLIDWLGSRLEPHFEQVMHDFLTSDRGRGILADLLADSAADFLGAGSPFAEQVVLRWANRLAEASSDFRTRLLDMLQNRDGLSGG